MIDGFCKDEVMQKLLQHFIGITKEQMPKAAAEMSRQLVPYGEVDLCDDLDEICRQVMSGVTALLLEGYEQGILIDARTYPARSVGEPEKDKVLRGSKDGFVETIVFNTALIRRRIRKHTAEDGNAAGRKNVPHRHRFVLYGGSGRPAVP